MELTAEIFFTNYGPAVRVFVDGDKSKPYEFALRGNAARTPMRQRASRIRAIDYVRSMLTREAA